MIESRFLEIERLITEAGRCFDPVTGSLESTSDDEDDADRDLDLASFLASLGISEGECAEYVQLKTRQDEERFGED